MSASRKPRRWSKWPFAALLVLIALWLGVSWLAVVRLTSRARPRFDESAPAELAGSIETVLLSTSDGEDLGAWFLEAARDDAPSVLELHGNGGTRAARLGAAKILREQGCAVLLVTLRAHGDSSGERVDFGWSSRHDVVAAVEWLEARRPGRPVLVHGSSLGAAAAVFAASELGGRVSGYALECLYTDLDTTAMRRCELYLPPLLDRVAWLGLRIAASARLAEFERISPLESIGTIPRNAPVLLLAGSADERAPVADSRALLEQVAGHGTLTVLDGAEHDRLLGGDPAAYRAALLSWLDSTR